MYIDNEIYSFFPKEKGLKELQDSIKVTRYRETLNARVSKPFYMRAQLTFTGVAGQTRSVLTQQVNYPLMITGASIFRHAPITTKTKILAQTRNISEKFVTPTTLFDDVFQSYERYFKLPAPIKLKPNDQLEITGISGVAGTTDLYFQCVLQDKDTYRSVELETTLTTQIKERIQQEWADIIPFSLVMSVPFTGVALQKVEAKTPKQHEPYLIYGMQRSAAIEGGVTPSTQPTAQFIDLGRNYQWSTEELPLWAWCEDGVGSAVSGLDSFIEFPYPIFLKPNTQIQGLFTNSAIAPITGGQIIFLCRKV
jgi:hypothetical protein